MGNREIQRQSREKKEEKEERVRERDCFSYKALALGPFSDL
jgi:hypothetical protein